MGVINSREGEWNNGDDRCKFERNPSLLNEKVNQGVIMYADDGGRGNFAYFRREEEEEEETEQLKFKQEGEETELLNFRQEEEPERLINFGEEEDISLSLPERWCSSDSGGLIDQSCGTSNWWEFWNLD